MTPSSIPFHRTVQAAGLSLAALTLLATAACAPNNRVVLEPETNDYPPEPSHRAVARRALDRHLRRRRPRRDRRAPDFRHPAFRTGVPAAPPRARVIAKPANNPEAGTILPSIRRALAEGGVSSAVVTSYAPTDPTEERAPSASPSPP